MGPGRETGQSRLGAGAPREVASVQGGACVPGGVQQGERLRGWAGQGRARLPGDERGRRPPGQKTRGSGRSGAGTRRQWTGSLAAGSGAGWAGRLQVAESGGPPGPGHHSFPPSPHIWESSGLCELLHLSATCSRAGAEMVLMLFRDSNRVPHFNSHGLPGEWSLSLPRWGP